jgi:hypothetical protein
LLILQEWDTIKKFYLENCTKLKGICFDLEIRGMFLPQNFGDFVIQFFQNSQNTLKKIWFVNNFFDLPPVNFVELKNLNQIQIILKANSDEKLYYFKTLIQSIIQNYPYLEESVAISNIDLAPMIRDYLISNFFQNCIYSSGCVTSLFNTPLKHKVVFELLLL